MSLKRGGTEPGELEPSPAKRGRDAVEEAAQTILELERALAEKLQAMAYPKNVKYVYNPLDYAYELHAAYVRLGARPPKKRILLLGMNPGPWGMSQTGVPFGEVAIVKEWFELSGEVGKPEPEHPERPVTGLECARSEVSGKRLWSLFRELCATPRNFFRHAYLHNYCPVALMDAKGCNITPADIKTSERHTLHKLCDDVLIEVLKILEVEILVGIGKFAEQRGETVLKSSGLNFKVVGIPHPSPRALNNTNWIEKARKRLEELDLLQYFTKDE